MIFIRPKKDLIVIHPDTLKPLGENGNWVELTAFWKRRLETGEVYQPRAKEKKKEAQKSPEKKEKTKKIGEDNDGII